MKTTAVIPARYASTRLPGKPLIELGGKPMIIHVCENVQRAGTVDRVVVATDDERIASVLEQNGCEFVMTSPELPSGTDRIATAVDQLGLEGTILNVQGDEPMIDPDLVDAIVDRFNESDADVATAVAKIESIAHLFDSDTPKVVLRDDSTALYFSRTPIPFFRDLDPDDWLEHHTFYRHIGLYLYGPGALERFVSEKPTQIEEAEQLEQLRMLSLGMKILCVQTTYDGLAVDSPEDVMRVEALLDGK